MKKNNHLSLWFLSGIFFLLLFSSSAYSQAVTGSIATRIFHNTGSGSNGQLTYMIELSNGWKPGVSTVTSLTLKNSGGTTVHTHSGSSINYGTTSATLAPGKYTFTGTVSTTNNSNSVVSVSLSLEIWIGYKTQWAKSLDFVEGFNQYSLKRSVSSTGISRAYAESYNSLAANTAGWIEMSAPANTNAGSSVFFVLENTNPATFSPSDNITYVEYFYTNSTTNGVRVKARNSSNVYTMYTLSGVVLGDKLRFERDASGNSKLYLNGTSTVSHTFAKTLTAAMTVFVHATLVSDEAISVIPSFGYPGTSYPLTNTFANDKGTGDLTIRISPLSGFQSPYHYFISEQPIPELKDVYKYLKDTIVTGTVDSTDFFTGPVSATNFTTNGAPMGNYYISAFDSRGVRILSTTYSLLPDISTATSRSGTLEKYDEYLSCTPGSYTTINAYLTENEVNGAVVFNLQDINAEQCFGILAAGDPINTGAQVYSKLKYGFYVKSGSLYTVENGTKSSTSYSVLINVPIRIEKSGTTILLIYNGTVLATYTPASSFEYKIGARFTEWGTKIRIKPYYLSMIPYKVPAVVSANACENSTVTLTVTYPAIASTTFHGVPVTARSFQLYTAAGTAVGSANQALFSGLAPGIYYIQGSVTAGSVLSCFQYVYAGYQTVWENSSRIEAQSVLTTVTPHAIGSSTVNNASGLYGQAIATGKLPASTAGWIVFTPRSVSSNTLLMNVLTLNEGPLMNAIAPPPVGSPALSFPVTGGINIVSGPSGQIYLPTYYSPNIPIVAQRNGSGVFTLTQNGSLIRPAISGYDFGRWKPAALIRKTASGFQGIVSNFQCAAATTDIFAQLEYELDGYYHIMKNGQIRFVFNQEYNTADLTFNIYNSMDKLIRTQANFPAISTTNGMNYLTIDVTGSHCIGGGFFYLEVINSKKERLYLRFFNDYSACTAEGEGGDDEDQ